MSPPAGDVTLDPGRGMAWVDEHGPHLVDYASCHLDPAPMLAAVIAALRSCADRERPGNVSDRAWLLAALRRECATGPGPGFLPGASRGGPDDRAVRRAWGLADPLGAETLLLLYRHELPLRDLAYVLALPTKETGRLVARTQDVVEILVSGLDGLARGRPICPETAPLVAAVFPDERSTAADFGAARTALLRHIVTCVVCKRPINIRYTVPQILSRPPVADLTPEIRQRLLDAVSAVPPVRPEGAVQRPPSSFGMPLAAPVRGAPAPHPPAASPPAGPTRAPSDSAGTPGSPAGPPSSRPAGTVPVVPPRVPPRVPPQVPPDAGVPDRGAEPAVDPGRAPEPAPEPPERPVRAFSQEDTQPSLPWPPRAPRAPRSRAAQAPSRPQKPAVTPPEPARPSAPAGSAATPGPSASGGSSSGSPGPGEQDTPLYNALLSQIRAREALAHAAEAVPAAVPADPARTVAVGVAGPIPADAAEDLTGGRLAGAQVRIVEVLARVGVLLRATALRIVIVVVAGAAGTVTGINFFAPASDVRQEAGITQASASRQAVNAPNANPTAEVPPVGGAVDGAVTDGAVTDGTRTSGDAGNAASGAPTTTATAAAAGGADPGAQQGGGQPGTSGAPAAPDAAASPAAVLMGAWGVQAPSVITLDAFGRGSLTISTTAGKPVKWRISASGLVVEPSSGTLKPGHTDVLTVRALRVRYWCGVPAPVTAPLVMHGPKGKRTATVRWSTC